MYTVNLSFGIIILKEDIYHVHLTAQTSVESQQLNGSFTMANSNSVLNPYEILPIDQENKYLRKLSYFIMKLFVVCTH